MLKEIKLPLNTSLLELATVSFFIAIGYSILYKYSFYSELGIEWYVYSLSPNFIILSSVKMLFSLLLGVFVGLFCLRNINTILKLAIAMFVILLITVLVFLLFRYLDIPKFFYFNTFWLFIMGFSLVNAIKAFLLMRFSIRFSNVRIVKILNIFYVFIIFVAIIYIPMNSGRIEAKNIKHNLLALDKALLKNTKQKWSILELNNDKLLLISKTKENLLAFKIVEYKDVDSIVESKD